MQDLYTRIKKRRQALSLSQEALASLLGYTSRSSIAKIEKGLVDLPQSRISAFADALRTTPAYLLGWEDVPDIIPASDDLVYFEVIGSVKAGYDGTAMETSTGEFIPIPKEFLHGHGMEEYFTLRVKGDSMYPQLLDGDVVLVYRCESVDSGNIAVVLYNGDEASLKKVQYAYGEDWLELVPINPEYKVKRIEGRDLEQCRILGKVVKMIRDV